MAFTVQAASHVTNPLTGPPFPDASSSINLAEAGVALGAYPLSADKAIAPSLVTFGMQPLDSQTAYFQQFLQPSLVTFGMATFDSQVIAASINIQPSLANMGMAPIDSHVLNVEQIIQPPLHTFGLAPIDTHVILQEQIIQPDLASFGMVALSPSVQEEFIIEPDLVVFGMSPFNGHVVVRGYPSFTFAEVRTTMPVSINGTTYVVDWGLFARQNAQSFRTSIDEGGDPLERSTADERLWKRSQWNWEQGAGQDYYDRRASNRSRYRVGLGVNPYDEGKLKLYDGATSEGETNVADMVVAGGYLYCLTPTAVRRAASAGGAFSSVTGLAASGLASITTDGNLVWVSDGTQIESFSGTGGATQYSTFNAHLVGYANGRLLATDTAAKGAIYEIQDGGATSTLIWTHPNSSFEWKKIIHAPNGIYLVGDAGGQSEVYKLTVADSTGDLVPPFPAVEMESGEIIRDMVHYGGLFLASTSRGFRLFTIADATGHLTYGKAIDLENEVGGGGIATRGEDIYVGWGGFQFTPAGVATITASGVAHVSLGEAFNETLVPAYTMGPSLRVGTATSDDVEVVTYFDGQVFWTVNGNLYSDQANPDVGYLEVGHVEFGSIDEDKRLVAAEVHHEPLPASTSVALVILDAASTDTTLVTSSTTSATSARSLVTDETGERWRVFLTLTPSGASKPVAERWTLEGIPTPSHVEDILFPVILKDEVEDEITQAMLSFNVWTEYSALKTLADSREIITVLIGSQTLKGYVYDVAMPAGSTYEWDEALGFPTGTYSVLFRTVEQ